MDAGGVDIGTCVDALAEGIAQPVRHGVIDGHVMEKGRPLGIGDKVLDGMGKGGGTGQALGVLMVLHVIGGRVREDDRGLGLADDGGDFAQERHAVGEFQVIGDGRVKGGPKDAGGLLPFRQTGAGGGGPIHLHRAAVAGAHIHVMQVPAPLLKEEHGASGNKFNVIRVGEESEDGGHGGMDSMLRQISHAVVTELHSDELAFLVSTQWNAISPQI